MTYADMFSKVKGLFMESDVSGISEHLAFQFNIIGEAEGIFYAEVKDGVLELRLAFRPDVVQKYSYRFRMGTIR